jgi:hypothetical protein
MAEPQSAGPAAIKYPWAVKPCIEVLLKRRRPRRHRHRVPLFGDALPTPRVKGPNLGVKQPYHNRVSEAGKSIGVGKCRNRGRVWEL